MIRGPLNSVARVPRNGSARALRALGETELKQLFAEQPTLTLDCHFCGQVYQYDQADLEWLS